MGSKQQPSLEIKHETEFKAIFNNCFFVILYHFTIYSIYELNPYDLSIPSIVSLLEIKFLLPVCGGRG